jgi:hypothetical protein
LAFSKGMCSGVGGGPYGVDPKRAGPVAPCSEARQAAHRPPCTATRISHPTRPAARATGKGCGSVEPSQRRCPRAPPMRPRATVVPPGPHRTETTGSHKTQHRRAHRYRILSVQPVHEFAPASSYVAHARTPYGAGARALGAFAVLSAAGGEMFARRTRKRTVIRTRSQGWAGTLVIDGTGPGAGGCCRRMERRGQCHVRPPPLPAESHYDHWPWTGWSALRSSGSGAGAALALRTSRCCSCSTA